jgi:nicotinamidase-related amidase
MTGPSIRLASRYYRTYPQGSPLGYAEETLELESGRTVFLLIDVYGLGFDSNPSGDESSAGVLEFYRRMVREHWDIVVNHIVPAKRAAKTAGLPIVYLSNRLSPELNDRSEWRNLSLRAHGIDVLKEWQEPNDILAFSKIVAPEPGESAVEKQHYSGFFETRLDSLLRSMDARNLVCVGFDSRICLGTTLIDAMYRNYRVIALRDAIGTMEETETADGHWADFLATRFIETNVGYTATTGDWVAACEAPGARTADA